MIASYGTGAKFLYPAEGKMSDKSESYGVAHAQSMYRQFRDVDESVYRAMVELMDEPQESTSGHPRASLAGALSLALAYINKICSVSDDVRIKSRVLIISVTDDIASQYIATMNCIFAAQKQRIPIDVAKLGGSTSFLQQACDSTNGIFMKIKHAHGLVQYLLSAYSVEPTLRPHLNMSTQRDVDFRAACFITKNVIDIGFVCSVCLCSKYNHDFPVTVNIVVMSIILPSGDCPMCGTEFSKDVIKRLLRKPVVQEPKKKKKKKLESANGTPT